MREDTADESLLEVTGFVSGLATDAAMTWAAGVPPVGNTAPARRWWCSVCGRFGDLPPNRSLAVGPGILQAPTTKRIKPKRWLST